MMDLKSTPYWQVYADAFALFKKCMPVRNDDAYWQRVYDDVAALFEKYKDTEGAEFAKREILSVTDELEHISKGVSMA